MSVAFSAPPERIYKNLKVLPKNISKENLDTVMKSFTAGLGVKCNFCHANSKEDPKKMDFASDEKGEKGIARKMMKMTNKINKKYFDYAKNDAGQSVQEVSCYSCHHGEAHPAKRPPARQGGNQNPNQKAKDGK